MSFEDFELDDEKIIDKNISKIMESANINFLIGAGLSSGAYNTLAISETTIDEYYDEEKIKKKLDKEEFKDYMQSKDYNYEKYIDLLKEDYREEEFKNFKKLFFEKKDSYDEVLEQYNKFIKCLKNILKLKENKKEINLFTTNYDLLLNEALIKNKVCYNDGFTRDNKFDLDSFLTIPTLEDINNNLQPLENFNIIKIHGSKDWQISEANEDDEIIRKIDDQNKDFIGIMPSHQKYNDIMFSHTYYELLNLFTNKLNRNNSILFLLGFSLRDQHILKLIDKALKRNKTLQIYCINYNDFPTEEMENLNEEHNNFKIIKPESESEFNFEQILKYFEEIYNQINNLEVEE